METKGSFPNFSNFSFGFSFPFGKPCPFCRIQISTRQCRLFPGNSVSKSRLQLKGPAMNHIPIISPELLSALLYTLLGSAYVVAARLSKSASHHSVACCYLVIAVFHILLAIVHASTAGQHLCGSDADANYGIIDGGGQWLVIQLSGRLARCINERFP
jgi:hypothetical protein